MELTNLKTHRNFEGRTQFWEHASTATKTNMRFSTFLPPGKVKGCLIWLSGLTCTDENFISKAGAQRYLAEQQLMVLCPDTSPRGLKLPGEKDSWDFGSGASFYLDATTPGYADHYRMETYICDELISMIHSEFLISKNKISIMGHSMGGHGALTLGLRHPKKFQSISVFSPIVNPVQSPWGIKAFKGYLGDNKDSWKAHDATELILAGKTHPRKILVDQGTLDEYLDNQLLTDHLVKASKEAGQDLEVRYREDYDHSYYFISTFIGSHIEYHGKVLGAV